MLQEKEEAEEQEQPEVEEDEAEMEEAMTTRRRFCTVCTSLLLKSPLGLSIRTGRPVLQSNAGCALCAF